MNKSTLISHNNSKRTFLLQKLGPSKLLFKNHKSKAILKFNFSLFHAAAADVFVVVF
jgi:hypothetical protein